MNRTTKIVIATGVAAVLGTGVFVGAVKARDAHQNWRERLSMGAMHDGGFGRGMGPGSAMFEHLDTNKDGTLTQAEIDQSRKDRLAKFDANKDGKLSLQEFEPLWLEFTRQQMVRAFQRLDSDGDALVTQDEYLKPMQHMVNRADRNNDGQLNQQDHRRHGRDAAPPTAPQSTPQATPPAAPKGGTK